ncbi:MAG: peptidyl-prolyl cis-trans isomerase [Polyangiaceae bacterium]|nr:peptidyl-prolyl cis-trans isomerase [Polyangiaceae bacterium]
MQRSSTVAIGVLLIAVVVLLVWRTGAGARPSAPVPVPSLHLPAPSFAPPALSLALPDASSLADPELAPLHKPLPRNAPKSVRLGVLLFQYRGAQFAPASARSKAEALVAAKAAVEPARKSFKAAVKSADPGSVEDAGKFAQGVLEPSIEYEVFLLPPGAVSDPIETPRGYWVVKRVE